MSGFPDIVTLMVGYLSSTLAPIRVATSIPAPRPTEFVQIRRVGGSAEFPVREHVRLDTFAWAATEVRAYQVGQMVREAIWALSGQVLGGCPVYEVGEFLGPTMTADEETRSPQLWATYELTVRADGAVRRA